MATVSLGGTTSGDADDLILRTPAHLVPDILEHSAFLRIAERQSCAENFRLHTIAARVAEVASKGHAIRGEACRSDAARMGARCATVLLGEVDRLHTARGGGKRGPAPQLQQQVERITRLPKAQQRFVMQMIDTAAAADRPLKRNPPVKRGSL